MAARGDQHRCHQTGPLPAHERAAVDADRLRGDARWDKIAGHGVTMSPEWPCFIWLASLATISIECHDLRYGDAALGATADGAEPAVPTGAPGGGPVGAFPELC